MEINDLTRGQMYALANRLVEMAGEMESAPRGKVGSPKDPAVRRLAALAIHDMHDVREMSFGQIGTLIGVTRERAHQLYKNLLNLVPQEAP